jgi:hypothetical protein
MISVIGTVRLVVGILFFAHGTQKVLIGLHKRSATLCITPLTFGADLMQDPGVPAPIEVGGNQECRAYQDADSTTDHRKSTFEGQTSGHTPLDAWL